MKQLQLVLGAVAVPLIVMAVGIAILTMPPKQSGTVQVPNDRASAVQVLRAFVDAVNAHDCDTAQALAAPDFVHDAQVWCNDADSIKDLEIVDSIAVRATSTNRVHIQVSFDLHWRLFHKHSELSGGKQDWSFELITTKGNARWRIISQGAA